MSSIGFNWRRNAPIVVITVENGKVVSVATDRDDLNLIILDGTAPEKLGDVLAPDCTRLTEKEAEDAALEHYAALGDPK